MLEKITQEQMEQHGVVSAPDELKGRPEDAKAVFDRLIREVVSKVVNGIIDAHNGLDKDVNERIDGVIEELKKISEINADNLGSSNIQLDKKGEDTLAKAYGLTSLVPTVYEALNAIKPVSLGGTGRASFVKDCLLFATGVDELSQLSFPAVTGSILRQGKNGAPYWTGLLELEKELGTICVEKITASKTWTAPSDLVGNTVRAYVFGGGGGGGSGGGGHADYGDYCGGGGGGGGGGHLTIGDISVMPRGTVKAVIGAGGAGGTAPDTQYNAGASGSKGGTSSFGSLSAQGGNGGGGGSKQRVDGGSGKGGRGGDGGTGGGGGSCANGGNGSYGGGGGGGNAGYVGTAGNGGSGGVYGGSGGGGNTVKKDGTVVYGISATDRLIFEEGGGVACPMTAGSGTTANGGSGGYGSSGGEGWRFNDSGTPTTGSGGGGGGGYLGAKGGSGLLSGNMYLCVGGGCGGGGFGPDGTGGAGCMSDYTNSSWGTASWAYGGGGGGFGPGGGQSSTPGYGGGGRGGLGGTKLNGSDTNVCNAGAGQAGGSGIIILVYRRKLA